VQSIKTAAIVIFMGTVMYGAYTSLTTPPETLPKDVEELIFDHEPSIAFDDESFDAGLADSLPELEINAGEPETAADTGFASVQSDQTEAVEKFDQDGPPIDTAVTARLSDSPAEPTVRQYATTPNSFHLPDPNQVVTDFTRSDNDFQLPQVAPDLALTSGISESGRGTSPLEAGSISSTVIQAASPSTPNLGIANAIGAADRQYADDQPKEALATLSIFYNTPNLSGQERAEMLARLDPLARQVIYSKQHLLEKPYRVGQRETLVDIAAKQDVPWQLLANINQISDPMTILPGTELKVVTGPFRAEVNLSQNELTLFLGDLYAGRFPIAVGTDPVPQPGTFTVQDKQAEHTYYNQSGSPVPAGSPENPYGSAWLDLGGQVSIHGSPDSKKPTDKGCISLADSFATDLYGILSPGSSVTIRR